MKAVKNNIKANLIYGAIVLIPVVIVMVLLFTLYDLLQQIAKTLSLQSPLDAGMAMLLLVVLLLVLCYALGAFIHTRVGNWTFARLEKRILRQLPFYKVLSNILKGFAKDEQQLQPALIRTGPDGVAAMGFQIADNGNGSVTVFIPTVPTITIGTLYVVDSERVEILDVSTMEYFDCISEWGVGSRALFDRDTPKTDPAQTQTDQR